MLRLDRILVARDFSSCGEQAVTYAVDLARRGGATLHVVYAEPVFMESTVLPGLYDEEIAKVQQALARLGPPEDARLGPERVRVAVVHGLSPGTVLCRYAQQHDIDLVVTGTHARRGWRRWLRGSVAESVVRRARRSVLVVPTGTPRTEGYTLPPMRTVLVAVAGPRDARAVEEARSLTALYGARMEVLHVISDEAPAGMPTEPFYLTQEYLRALVEEVPGPDVQVTYHVLSGSPDEAILEFVQSTDVGLLVLGPHVRHRRWLQRDRVRQLLRTVPCPVYVARSETASQSVPAHIRAAPRREHPVAEG